MKKAFHERTKQEKATYIIRWVLLIATILILACITLVRVRAGQHVPMPLIGCIALVIIGIVRIFFVRKDFQQNDEERKKFNKILLRSILLTIVIMVVFITVVVLSAIN